MGKKITEYDAASVVASTDLLLLEQAGGTRTVTPDKLAAYTKDYLDNLSPGAGFHNGVYRGEYLGDALTDAQAAVIADGTFEDLFIGDYWTIDGVNWRIAAFDYWLGTGDSNPGCTDHHVVVVPDTCLYDAKMNDTDTAVGAYVGSKMYTTYLEQAKSIITAAFGAGHILTHRELLSNAVSNGAPSNWSWYDSTVELMNEVMVYGSRVWGNSGYDVGIDKSQLPLFALRPDCITNRAAWWLRAVYSSTHFACVDDNGRADHYRASHSYGVRPAFGIC